MSTNGINRKFRGIVTQTSRSMETAMTDTGLTPDAPEKNKGLTPEKQMLKDMALMGSALTYAGLLGDD